MWTFARRSVALCVMAMGLAGTRSLDPVHDAPARPDAPAEAIAPAASANHPLGPAFASGAKAALIPIRGDIYDFTLTSLRHRVQQALDDGAGIIVIEINTKGGLLTSGLDIAKYIKTIPVPTLAWINPEAYSAGALIATAADAIVMSPASATGDCAPVSMFGNLDPTERSKVLSPLLEEFRDSARANGYDYATFHAMCELGVKLFFVEHIQTGQRRLVNQFDFEVMVNGRDPSSPGFLSQVLGLAEGADVPVKREVAGDEDKRMWKPVTQLPSGAPLPGGEFHDGRTLLTLNQDRALDIGLSKATVQTVAELQQLLGATAVTPYSMTWSQQIAGWLTHPLIKTVLIVLLLGGLYFELQSPGLGAGGIIAAVALLALMGAPFLVGLAEIWHIIAFFLGFVLLMLEIFVTPGFGVLGISGIVLMCIGLVFVGVPTAGGGGIPGALPAPEQMAKLQASALAMVLALMLSFVGIYFLGKHFGTLPLLGRLILKDPATAAALDAEEAEAPPPAPPTHRHVSGDEALGEGQIRVGDLGTVVAPLRPAGRAVVNGHSLDVTSDGAWIDAGVRVRVAAIRGNLIFVEKA